jgi:hypothetical protein
VLKIRESGMENTGRGGSVVRSLYLIDRFRVVFEWGGGWNCACADFVSSNACRHTREAAGRRAAQAEIAERVAEGRSRLSIPVDSRRMPRDLGQAAPPACAPLHAVSSLPVDPASDLVAVGDVK